MNDTAQIKVAIVDDNKEFIDSLTDHLDVAFPEIEVCGTATRYKQARELLLNEKPDLVFLDVEMPCKNGFELLNEMRNKGCNFSVIFYTAYDKYMIQALRESAFDYIIKPVKEQELKQALERFKEQKKAQSSEKSTVPLLQGFFGQPEVVALPTSLGLRFVDKTRILLFRCIKDSAFGKACWEALLIDYSSIKLGANTSSERIVQLMNKERFVQINQSCIINMIYLSLVEFKTRDCILLPPFDNMKLTVSRTQLAKLKEIYELF